MNAAPEGKGVSAIVGKENGRAKCSEGIRSYFFCSVMVLQLYLPRPCTYKKDGLHSVQDRAELAESGQVLEHAETSLLPTVHYSRSTQQGYRWMQRAYSPTEVRFAVLDFSWAGCLPLSSSRAANLFAWAGRGAVYSWRYTCTGYTYTTTWDTYIPTYYLRHTFTCTRTALALVSSSRGRERNPSTWFTRTAGLFLPPPIEPWYIPTRVDIFNHPTFVP